MKGFYCLSLWFEFECFINTQIGGENHFGKVFVNLSFDSTLTPIKDGHKLGIYVLHRKLSNDLFNSNWLYEIVNQDQTFFWRTKRNICSTTALKNLTPNVWQVSAHSKFIRICEYGALSSSVSNSLLIFYYSEKIYAMHWISLQKYAHCPVSSEIVKVGNTVYNRPAFWSLCCIAVMCRKNEYKFATIFAGIFAKILISRLFHNFSL